MANAAVRLLLALLCLILGPACKALSLSPTNSTPVATNQSEEFYDYQGHRCKMCPAGSYVAHHCETSGAETLCQPCSSDSFTSHPNSFHACFPCKICRSLDQVESTSCTQTRNAVCTCKEGTFCSPNLPCETCHKCRPRCPDGEEMVQHCTAQSDIQCVPIPTSSPTPSSGTSNSKTILLVCGITVIAIILGIIIFLVCKWKKTPWCCFRGHTRTVAKSIRSKTLLWLQTKFTRGQQESEDNERNTQVDLAPQWSRQSHPGPSATKQLDETTPLQEEECRISIGRERRKLVPADGSDPDTALERTFTTFVKEVPIKKWHFYMMVLGLTDNEIEIARANAINNVSEQHFQMLRKWQDKNGKEASLDTLLEKLCDPTVDLKGVERKIRDSLISRHLCVYEE